MNGSDGGCTLWSAVAATAAAEMAVVAVVVNDGDDDDLFSVSINVL